MSDDTVVDDQVVLDTLRQVVAEKGADYVYQSAARGACFYVVDDQPSCIVGHVIARLFPDLLPRIAQTSNNCNAGDLRGEGLLPVSTRALTALRAAQIVQDNGGRWGAALQRAVTTYKEGCVYYDD